MMLTLTIINADRLDDGAPSHLVLNRRGAVIGRSARCDWTLPDPDRHVSLRHCEVAFADGIYILSDLSTNGTILNGAPARMDRPRLIEPGDRFDIGRYGIVATFSAIALDAETMLDPDEKADPAFTDGGGMSVAPAVDPLDGGHAPPTAPDGPPLIEAFAAGAALDAGQFKADAADTLERAGVLLRRLITGLTTLVAARARAKSELGADTTALSFDGNNPIKFARQPEQALIQLLNPRERGFMDAAAAVDDAFDDLQAHQLATLKAMQGALRVTLDRFSPTAIRGRADTGRLMARILPGARDAALWQAYQREFAGVADGSDEAFMDVFAKEFRQAYTDLARKPD